MTGLLMSSHYYTAWNKHSSLKDTAKYAYSRQFMKFEEYLELDFDGVLDFDRFYFDSISQSYRPIDVECIDGYIQFLKDKYQASKGTLYNNIVYLKCFFNLLFALGLTQCNPMRNYPNPYYERRIIDRALSVEECKRMLNASLHMDPFVRKYFILLLLMTTTALRNRETIRLTYQQIDFERNVILINKGQKTTSEVVYMPDSLVIEFKRYLEHPEFTKWKEGGHSEVFFHNNCRLSAQSLNTILQKLSKDAGIERHITARYLRHTTAYLMQRSGVDIVIIKRQLRHKQLSTTLRYCPPVDATKLINEISDLILE